MKDFLHKTHKRYDVGMAMTITMSSVETFQDIFPEMFIYTSGYDFNAAERFLNTCLSVRAQNKKRASVLCLEDLAYNSKVMKTIVQRNIHFNGRHSGITLFNTSQSATALPPSIRGNVDYIIATKDPVLSNQRKLYEFFFGLFDNFHEFQKVYLSCVDNYGALVLDKTASSTRVEDCISWYRASTRIPAFRISKPMYFALDNMIREYLHRTAKTRSAKVIGV